MLCINNRLYFVWSLLLMNALSTMDSFIRHLFHRLIAEATLICNRTLLSTSSHRIRLPPFLLLTVYWYSSYPCCLITCHQWVPANHLLIVMGMLSHSVLRLLGLLAVIIPSFLIDSIPRHASLAVSIDHPSKRPWKPHPTLFEVCFCFRSLWLELFFFKNVIRSLITTTTQPFIPT